jgi:hypothetical protein
MMIEGSGFGSRAGSGSGSIPLTSADRRIRNTAHLSSCFSSICPFWMQPVRCVTARWCRASRQRQHTAPIFSKRGTGMKLKICSRSSSGRSDQDGAELALLILILQKKYVHPKSACYFSVFRIRIRIRIQAILNIPAAPA